MVYSNIATNRKQKSSQNNFRAFKLLILLMYLLFEVAKAQVPSSSDTSQTNSNIFTTYDGVTQDQYVSYLQMDGSTGATISLDNQKLNQKLDYTVMVWFKPQSDYWGSFYQYAFSFDDSLECYFTASAQLMCQSESMIDKLAVDISNVQQNQWTHLTVSGTPKLGSYLTLEQNLNGIIAQDSDNYLVLQQKAINWTFCLGSCVQEYAFIGGFRELVIVNQYIQMNQASKIKNHYLLYDSSLLAYYRFSDKNLLKSEFKNLYIQSQQGFSIGRDYIPNDICYPLNDYYQFYQLNGGSPLQSVQIDGRWNPLNANWGYSFTMRIKFNSQTCYASSPAQAQFNCHLMILKQAFMIYMNAPNQVAAYFFNNKVYYEYQTRSVFVPDDQWVDLQFQASQYYGYELRVYDILGRQISNASEVRNLQNQNVVNKQLSLFRNVVAQIKDFTLYSEKKNLPLEVPDVDFSNQNSSLYDKECLFFLSFQTAAILTTGSTSKFINYCRSQKFNQNLDVTIINPLSMTPAYWQDYTYGSSYAYGLINAKATLFDGIACKDQNKYPRLASNNSYIKSTIQNVSNNMPNVTVEFWFKVDTSQTQYLTTNWAQNRSREFMSIYLNTQKSLICAPFGIDSAKAPFITYSDYTEQNRKSMGWFHITCQYEQQNLLIGYLYSKNLEQQYNASLQTIGTLMQNDTYEIYFGNNKYLSLGTSGFNIREYRFWAIKRSLSDIQQWRNRQIDPRSFTSTQLMGYFRFSDGAYNDTNFIYMINPNLPDYSVYFNNVNYVSDSSVVICPINTYISQDFKCYLNPIQYTMGAIYPDYDSSSNNLNWLFSSNETIILTPQLASQMQVNWVFDDSIMKLITQKNNLKSQQNMRLSSASFRDENFYKMKLNISNSDLTYLVLYPMTFVPNSCQFYLISSSNKYSDYLSYNQPLSQNDISFNFYLVQRKSYCNEVSFFNVISQQITYQTSPPLTQYPKLQYTFNNDNTITVTIPKAEQYKIPIQQDIKFIFKLSWTNTQLQSQIQLANQLTFQNLQYTLRMNYAGQSLVPSLVANTTSILKGDGVFLNTSGTYVIGGTSQDLQRVQYQWICPQIFSTVCPTDNRQLLSIDYLDFTYSNGQFNKTYTFTVNMTYTKSGNQGTLINSVSVNLIWYDIDSTSFTISSPNPILSTADTQQISLVFSKFDTTKLPSYISIQWSITPNITKNTLSQNNSILTVAKNGFQLSTNYSISVTVKNINNPDITTQTQTLTFKTQTPPSGGQASITPLSGYTNYTNFTISLSNWTSSNNSPIKYRVWSTTSSNGLTPKTLISASWILSTQTFTFQAQDTFPYIIQITDSTQEITQLQLFPNVQIYSNQSTNTSSNSNSQLQKKKLNQILATKPSQTKYSQLVSYAQENLSSNDSDPQSSESLQQAEQKTQIINSISQDVYQMQQTDNEDNKYIAKGSVQVLSILLQNPDDLNEQIVKQSLDVIQQIQKSDSQAYNTLKKDSTFKNSLAQVVSGVMKFTKRLFGKNRILQQDQAYEISDQARQLKDDLLQQLCEDAVANSMQQQIITSSFDLLVQKFTMDSFFNQAQFLFLDDGRSGLNFQINDIANELSQFSQIADSFCIETTFYKFNPQQTQKRGFAQYSSSIFEYKLADDYGINQYQSNQYNPSQNVEINFAMNPDTFKNNQSVCMAYIASINDWSSDPCLTIIDEENLLINCQCNMIDTLYFGIFTDTTRIEGQTIKKKDVEPKSNTNIDITNQPDVQIDSSFAFLSVVFILLSISIIFPSFAIILDGRDSRQAQTKNLTNSQMKIIARLSVLTKKPLSYWISRQDDIIGYTLASKSMFSYLLTQSHPLISIFTRFDILEQRIWRFTFYFFQITIFSLICILSFGNSYRANDRERVDNNLDQRDVGQIIGIGFLGMILLLPFPYQYFFVRNTVKLSKLDENDNQRHELNQRETGRKLQYLPESNSLDKKSSPYKNLGQNHLDTHAADNQNQIDSFSSNVMLKKFQSIDTNKRNQLSLVKRCSIFKYALLILSYILCLGVIVQSFIYSTQVPVSNQYCLVATFYIGFFGSILISNILIVAINSQLIEKAIEEDSCILKSLTSYQAQQVYKEMQQVKQIMNEIKNQKTKKQVHCQDQNLPKDQQKEEQSDDKSHCNDTLFE